MLLAYRRYITSFSKKVAITGITGHLGYVLARQLIERGYEVTGVIRNLAKAKELPWISGLGIELRQADMTDQGAMTKALSGIDGLFHVAAVFDVTAAKPQKDVIQKNLLGTESTLTAAAVNGLGKIVYTSSVAAIGTSARPDEIRDESCWNEGTKEPYALSKTLSEHKAWELSRERGLNLITVLPSTMLGPQFHALNPSLKLVSSMLKGELPMAPPFSFNYVDVRDVARSHIDVYESPNAQGRYIVENATLSVFELAREVKSLRPAINVPAKEMPVWFARVFPAIDKLQNTLTGSPRQMTSGFVHEYVGRFHTMRAGKFSAEFGWSPRPFKDTLKDTIEWFEKE